MTTDGIPTAAEVRRLEAEADALLKKDARAKGFIKPNGRGFTAYARSIGITTKKILETTYKHEAVGFSDEQLGTLAAGSGMDNRVQGTDDREEA